MWIASAVHPVPSFGSRMVYTSCGIVGADELAGATGNQNNARLAVATLIGSTDEQTMRCFILAVALLLDPAAVLLRSPHHGRPDL